MVAYKGAQRSIVIWLYLSIDSLWPLRRMGSGEVDFAGDGIYCRVNERAPFGCDPRKPVRCTARGISKPPPRGAAHVGPRYMLTPGAICNYAGAGSRGGSCSLRYGRCAVSADRRHYTVLQTALRTSVAWANGFASRTSSMRSEKDKGAMRWSGARRKARPRPSPRNGGASEMQGQTVMHWHACRR